MRLLFLALGLAGTLGAASPAQANQCSVNAKDREAASRLDWDQFDQTGGRRGSFRDLARRKCYAAAIEAYRDWLRVNGDFPDGRSKGIGMFHIGQSLAFSGNIDGAISMMRQAARKPEEESRAAIDWNTYVEGVLAFLSGDRNALGSARSRLSQSNREFAREQTKVLNGLERCLGKSYADAMSKRCRA